MNIIHKNQLKLSAFILLFYFILVSCGGGGGDKVQTQISSLSVTISGLPNTIPANVVVSGPGGFSQTITSSTTFNAVTSGTYQIAAQTVTGDVFQYTASAETQTLSVVTGQTPNVDVNYLVEDSLIEGEITGFGSVFVNGIELNTDNSVISTDESDDDSESILGIGMRVRVVAKLNHDRLSGIASFISYRAHIEGPVTLINLAESELVVLGQIIKIDELTYFVDTSFESLLEGDFVEVSGIESPDGLLATRIKLVPALESEFRLRGTVSLLDETIRQFNIGDLLIDYGQADVDGQLANDALVRISSDIGVINSIFIAEDVEVVVPLMEGEPANIEGLITRFRTHQDFDIDGRPIMTNNTTMYQNGDANELGLNIRVRVFGRRNEGQVVIASQIRFLHPVIVEVKGDIDTIDLQANSVQLLGTNVLTDSDTRFIDHSDAQIRQFSLADLGIGDRVEIRASELESDDLSLLARRLIRLNNDDDAVTELSGEILTINRPMFSIHQTIITVSAFTRFEGAQDNNLTMTQFFDQLALGQKLKISGQRQADGRMLAIEAEFESEEEDNNGRVELRGNIDTFSNSESFTVNGHRVTTNENTQFVWGNENNLAIHAQVKIKGVSNQNRIIAADKVEFDKGKSCQTSFEGTVESIEQGNHIIVNGVTIAYSAQTEFENGTSDDIAIGVALEVIGCVNDAGYIIADKILFEN